MSKFLENNVGFVTGTGSAAVLAEDREDAFCSATTEMVFADYIAVAATPATRQSAISKWQIWSAVGCVHSAKPNTIKPVY